VAALRAEMRTGALAWARAILADPQIINSRFFQAFAVFHFCRVLHDLETGRPGSKRAAAEWGKTNLPARWTPLIDAAWAGRPNPALSSRTPADPAALRETLALVEEAVRRLEGMRSEETMPTYYGLHGKLIAVDGARDPLAGILLEAAEALRRNPDCRLYVVHVAEDDANGIWVTEAWTSQQAHDDSLQPDEVRALIARARPLIAGFGERQEFETLGGVGLPVRAGRET
jgi:quinol monooxygenase YgiN